MFLRAKDLPHWFRSSKSTQEHHGNVLMMCLRCRYHYWLSCWFYHNDVDTWKSQKNTDNIIIIWDLQSRWASHKIKRLITNQRNKRNSIRKQIKGRRLFRTRYMLRSMCVTVLRHLMTVTHVWVFRNILKRSAMMMMMITITAVCFFTLLDRLSLTRSLRLFLSLMDGERRRLLMRLLMVKDSISLRVQHSHTSAVKHHSKVERVALSGVWIYTDSGGANQRVRRSDWPLWRMTFRCDYIFMSLIKRNGFGVRAK